MLLRGTLSNKWAAQVQNEVTSFNKTPIERLGRLVPNSINSELDSVKVDEARWKHNIETYTEPNFETQIKNQALHIAEKNLLGNDFVYKNFDITYDVSVREFCCEVWKIWDCFSVYFWKKCFIAA